MNIFPVFLRDSVAYTKHIRGVSVLKIVVISLSHNQRYPQDKRVCNYRRQSTGMPSLDQLQDTALG